MLLFIKIGLIILLIMAGVEGGPLYIESQYVSFASAKDRRRMEITQQVEYLSATLAPLPIPEDGYDLTPISFASENKDDGATALFHLGEGGNSRVHGDIKNGVSVTFAKPRTIQILDALGIPYVNHALLPPPQ